MGGIFMKKLLVCLSCFLAIFLLSGCSMDNTPTKKVEHFLDNYRSLNDTVLSQMDEIVSTDNLMSDDQKATYKETLKRQYQDLTYTIKDETIDGDNATVTAEIEVYDYYKITQESDAYYNTNPKEFQDESGNLVQSKYIDYRIGKLKDASERIKYTIDFTLKKVDKEWVLDDINDVTRQKIHGLYAY